MMNVHVNTNSDIDPQKVYALVVGIEDYARSETVPNLNGPTRDALQFCSWLLRRAVPTENIHLFLSPLEKNVDEVELELNALSSNLNYKRAARFNLNQSIMQLKQKEGSNSALYIFWSGHGFITKLGDTTRRLFYSDTTLENRWNLDLDSLLQTLQTAERGSGFPHQYFFIDACANPIYRGFYPTLDADAVADKFITSGVTTQPQY